MKILVIHGPNLNLLGRRDPAQYGTQTLREIDDALRRRAEELGAEVVCFQSNGEGALIDAIQEHGHAPETAGIIINPGAYGHYAYAIHDALLDTGKPVVEVHLSNVYARDEWRRRSVIAPMARGVVSGFGWRSYTAALEILIAQARERGVS